MRPSTSLASSLDFSIHIAAWTPESTEEDSGRGLPPWQIRNSNNHKGLEIVPTRIAAWLVPLYVGTGAAAEAIPEVPN